MNKQEFQQLRIKIIINHLNVFGVISVPINGYRSRLSDLLNNNQDFIALTDVEIYQDQKLIEKTPFMCINKQAIMFLCEADISQLAQLPKNESEEIDYNENLAFMEIA